jgi:hypothetical protein
MKNATLGAIVILIGVLGQGCIANRITDSEDRKHYSEYLNENQRINLDREKAGLPAQQPLSFEQWRGGK